MAVVKCEKCGQEIAWSKICMYCGAVPAQQGKSALRPNAKAAKRGRWPGRIKRGDAPSRRSVIGVLPTLYRYFSDPTVAWWKKGIIVGGVVYVLSPLDMIPEVFPIFGFLDDVAVATITWRLLVGELKKYTDKRL